VSNFVAAPWASPWSVSSVLVIPPAVEPITLAQAKLYANLDWPTGDPRDALMNGFISAARQKVEQDTGLALLTQTRNVTITVRQTWYGFYGYWDAFGYNGYDGYYWPPDPVIIPLPNQARPLQSITQTDGAPVDPTLPWWNPVVTTDYQIVAGWADPATLLLEAPLLVHAVGLLTAHYATLGRDIAAIIRGSVLTIPLGYDEAISPYRLVWVT
jgi:hypothetical protein